VHYLRMHIVSNNCRLTVVLIC